MTTEQPAAKFHVVVLDSSGAFSAESFQTEEELVARLKALINTDVSVSCFYGDRLPVSKAPYRHLILHDHSVALYDVPSTLEADDSGYLGADPALLEGPPVINHAPPATAGENDFFSEETDNIGSIFDDALPDPDD